MNFDLRFKEIEEKQKQLKTEIDNLSRKYSDAHDFTKSFLDCCKKHNIRVVSINVRTKKIERSVSFPFEPYGSVFANGNDENGHPKIWRVCDDLSIGGGSGNDCQHTINKNAAARLIDGVYEVKDGVWNRVEEQ